MTSTRARLRSRLAPRCAGSPIRRPRSVPARCSWAYRSVSGGVVPAERLAAGLTRLMPSRTDTSQVVAAFELFPPAPNVRGRLSGDLAYTEIRQRLRSQTIGAETPEGLLWALDLLPSGEIVGCLRFCSDQIDESTVGGLAAHCRQVLQETLRGTWQGYG